jgi:ribosomal protein L11 methyltransferase
VTWLAVRARPSASQRDAAIAALFQLGCQGVIEEGDDIVTHLPDPVDSGGVSAALRHAGVECSLEFSPHEPVNWVEKWKHGLRRIAVGSMWVSPPWLAAEDEANTIVIDPGMGFGTGDHPSTRCALLSMETWLRAGDRVADLGAGSGILSIAAARLGAAHVTAIEIDPDAVKNAEANIALNKVESRVLLLNGDAAALLSLVAPVNLIAANMESRSLLELLPAMEQGLAPGGHVILSGLLLGENMRVRARVAAAGWWIPGEETEGSWCALTIARRR